MVGLAGTSTAPELQFLDKRLLGAGVEFGGGCRLRSDWSFLVLRGRLLVLWGGLFCGTVV